MDICQVDDLPVGFAHGKRDNYFYLLFLLARGFVFRGLGPGAGGAGIFLPGPK